jgi:hypothetical protein
MKVTCPNCGKEMLITDFDQLDVVMPCVFCRVPMKIIPYAIAIEAPAATMPIATVGHEYCACRFPIRNGGICMKCKRKMIKLA